MPQHPIDIAAAVLVVQAMKQRHIELVANETRAPGVEGILTSVEQLVIEHWLDKYNQFAGNKEQPTNA